MRITVHPAALDGDIHITTTAEIPPSALRAVPEREWVATPDDTERRGYFKATGHDLTDDAGRTLYSVPANASTLDGYTLRGVYFRVRELREPLPPLTYLRPTGDVTVEFSSSGNGSMTITSDSLEPIDVTAAHKAGDIL